MDRQSPCMETRQQSAQMSLVSIVITTYNQVHFLAEAIESALEQTTAEPVQVIVVDDGSADDPAAVVAGYPDVRLLRQANRGTSAARNAGWRAARSPYIVFLDGDDRLLPDAVAINLRQFASNPECAFVYGAYRLIDGEARTLDTPRNRQIGDDAYAALLLRNCVGMHGTVMYRRDLLEASGGFDTRLAVCEDVDLFFRLTGRHPAASSPELVAEYRKHDGNTSDNLPLMLRTDLQVLRNQNQHIGVNAHWRAAYAAGRRRRKKYYANRQMNQLGRAFGGGHSGRQASVDAAKVFAMAPVAFLGAAYWTAVRRLYKHLGLPRPN